MSRAGGTKKMRFAEEYARDPSDATAAGRRAGLEGPHVRQQVSRWLKDPQVLAKVESVQAEVGDASGLDPHRVLSEAWRVYELAVEGRTLVDRRGVPVMDESGHAVRKSELAVAVKALELVAKLTGALAPRRVEVDTTVEFVLDLGQELGLGVGEGYDLPAVETRELPA